MNNVKNSHCSFCGAENKEDIKSPYKCYWCTNITYLNPIPCTAVVVKIKKDFTERQKIRYPAGIYHHDGLLFIERGIEPKEDTFTFPGGYMELNETWQECAARELYEEVGLQAAPNNFNLITLKKSDYGNLIIFGEVSFLEADILSTLSDFKPNTEVKSYKIWWPTERLIDIGFKTHEEVVKDIYFRF